jgi:hypothetical protein
MHLLQAGGAARAPAAMNASSSGQVGMAGAQPWRATTIAPQALPHAAERAIGSPAASRAGTRP